MERARQSRWLLGMPAVWAAVALLVCLTGGCSQNDMGPPPPAARAVPAEATPARAAEAGSFRGPRDVTFYVTADTHFGASVRLGPSTHLNPAATSRRVELREVNEHVVAELNAMAGRDYPDAIGGKVSRPRGLLVAGDLTEQGRKEEWQQFLRCYQGEDGRGGVNVPVFEVIGNHDGGGPVKQASCQRHGGCTYALTWDDVRIIALSDGPDGEGLAFLRRELERHGPQRPVVLFLHFSLAGPFSRFHWFGDGDYRTKLRQTIAGYRIVAIFHGHFHGSGHYRWHGVDTYNVGSVKHHQRSFAVVRIGDEQLSVSSWNYEGGYWWWWHAKPLGRAGSAPSTGEIWGVDRGPTRPFRSSHPYPLER